MSSSKTRHMWHHWLQWSANATTSNGMIINSFWAEINLIPSRASFIAGRQGSSCLFTDTAWCAGSQSVSDRGYRLKVLLQRRPFVRQGHTWKERKSSCRWTVRVSQSSGALILALLTLVLDEGVRVHEIGWPPCQKWNTSIKTDKNNDEQRRRSFTCTLSSLERYCALMCGSANTLPSRPPYWSELVSLYPWCDFSWPKTVCCESPASRLQLLLLPNQEYTIHAICFPIPMYHMLVQCQSPASSFSHCLYVPQDCRKMTCWGHLRDTMTMWNKAARLTRMPVHTHTYN